MELAPAHAGVPALWVEEVGKDPAGPGGPVGLGGPGGRPSGSGGRGLDPMAGGAMGKPRDQHMLTRSCYFVQFCERFGLAV